MEYITNNLSWIVGANIGKFGSDPDAGNPNRAWEKRSMEQRIVQLPRMDPKTPIRRDHVRFVCISDTHNQLEHLKTLEIPAGDVLLHAGDLSMYGKPEEIDVVNNYLGTLPHKYKVIIAGNHDMTFDRDLVKRRSSWIWSMTDTSLKYNLEPYGVESVHEMLTNCIYLQDSTVEIYGIKIYGSPWTPWQYTSWGFQLLRGPNLMKRWNKIPTDTDVLLTHCPPCGYGDKSYPDYIYHMKRKLGLARGEQRAGCVDLLNTIQRRVKPQYHIYGHIHEGYGVRTDGTTTFINASTCTASYWPSNPPIVFDVPIPAGYSKERLSETQKKNE